MSDVDNIRWNLWLLSKTGQRIKWLGQITDPHTGFEWIKKQGKKATQFAINNVPPDAGRTQRPERVVQGMPDGQVVQTGEVMMPKPVQARTAAPRRLPPSKIDNSGVRTEGPGFGRRNAERPEAPKVSTAKRPARKAPAPKPMEVDPVMAKEAAILLDKHKADEAAELAAAEAANAD
jgi:hypothetical protein